jgi:hypothetical protein
MFKRRTGRERPEELVIADNIRKHEAEVERKLVREAVLRAERSEERRRARER